MTTDASAALLNSVLAGRVDDVALGETRTRLVEHLLMVLKHNKTLNLTAITDLDDAMRLHIVDSLMALDVLDRAPEGPIADMGSGAGYPGIPLAIVSGRQTTLVEATRKRCVFLEEVVSSVGLPNVSVRWSRVEELDMPGKFSFVTARAVSSSAALVELASPLLREAGVFCALKGDLDSVELQEARRTAEIVGMELEDVRTFALPGGTERRSLLVGRKTGESTVRLPRRPGQAQKKPVS